MVSGEDIPPAAGTYLKLGWPVEERDGTTELITGTVIDALEVPKPAAVLAAAWWRHTEGYPDEIRGLPALPDPRQALAVISVADRHFFLARAGECPWETEDPLTSTATERAHAAVIRWHSLGSRIPAPPPDANPRDEEADREADQVTTNRPRPVWAHWPDRGCHLPSPPALLHLLATAASTARLGPHMLALDQGVLVIPALGDQPLPRAGTPPVSPRLGFGLSPHV